MPSSETNDSAKKAPTETDLQTIRSDLNALIRVKHRLTMLDTTEKLSSVLQKLLPRLFLKMNDNDQQLLALSTAPEVREVRQQMQDQFVELLSQTMQRVRDETSCLVPCVELLQLFMTTPQNTTDHPEETPTDASSSVSSSNLKSFSITTVNLALAFVQVGMGRGGTMEDAWTLLPILCHLLQDSAVVLGAASSSHERITHLLISTLLGIVVVPSKGRSVPVADAHRLAETKALVQHHPPVAAMLYELFLDILLYQPTTATIPPAGLSNTGWGRLKSGATTWNRDRAALVQLKLAVLELIAPAKRYRWFLPQDLSSNATSSEVQSVNTARTVVLLIVASSDPTFREVSEFASSQLKQHLDIIRTKDSNDGRDVRRSVLGDPMVEAMELIALCLGQVHAESILKSSPHLGVSSSTNGQRLDKRRPLDETTQSPILMAFVSNNILNEYPALFDEHSSLEVILSLSGVVIQLAQRILSTVTGGLSTQRAKPYLAAASLLNALTIRLCVLYDRLCTTSDATAIADMLCRAFAITCDVLTPVATSVVVVASTNRSAMAGVNDGSIAVRDACYGIVATVSRSHLAIHPRGYLFRCGKVSSTTTDDGVKDAFVVSIDTASILFACTSNEEERLRPRSVAALDALLAAYCRACIHDAPRKSTNGVDDASQTKASESSNPWLTVPSAGAATTKTSISESNVVLAKSLLPLLWTAAQSHQPKASRVAASRWAGALLKDIDLLNACHILCFLAGDSDTVVSSTAREGLGLPSLTSVGDEFLLAIDSSDYTKSKFPDFSDFTTKLFTVSLSSRQQSFWDFSYHGRIATLRCGLFCLLNDLYGGEDVAVGTYLMAVMKSLQEVIGLSFQTDQSTSQGTASIDLLDECTTCLLTTLSASQFARLLVAGKGAMKLPISVSDIRKFAVSANSSRARRYFSSVFGKLLEDSSVWTNSPAENCDAWLNETELISTLEMCSNHLVDVDKRNPPIGRLHGSSFLGAQCVRAFRLLTLNVSQRHQSPEAYTYVNNILQLLGKGVLHDDDIVSNSCSDCLIIAFSYDTTDAPSLDFRFCISSASVVSNLTRALSKFGHSDTVNPARTLSIAKSSGVCLAATGATSDLMIDDMDTENRISLQRSRLECVNALFELLGSVAYRKEEEIGIIVGESLALFADFSSSESVLGIPPKSLDWPKDFDQSFVNQLPPDEFVLYILLRKIFTASSPHKRTSCAPALLAIVARGTNRVQNNSENVPLVLSLLNLLNEVQQVFLTILADLKGKQFSRESSCLGLTACRGLVSSMDSSESNQAVGDLNHRLLRAFGQTTNYGGSAMIETEAQAAARRATEGVQNPGEIISEVAPMEVGGASGIGEAALGAYREMASASVALERQDIMYGLLFLSLSHPYWQSPRAKHRYSAASLLGESLSLGLDFRDALRPHLGKLIPRILRGCHDPNKQTKDQMASLWQGLTGGGAEGRLAVSQHLLPTIDTLIKDCSSKLWRARVGACGALSEIIVGRNWEELGGGGPILSDDDLYESSSAGTRLIQIWTVAARALDDVQGAVRDHGEVLARSARALTIRLCSSVIDPYSDNKHLLAVERDAAAAAGTSLWWLMRKGINHTCPEVIGICLSTLVEVVGVVRPAILEPSLSTLLSSLLLAVSALEPAALNYMQLRTDDQDGLERARLQIAQSGPLAAAVTKCLELVPFTKLATQQSIAPALDTVLRQSAGFASRAATADAVSTLCNSCPTVFQSVGSLTTNPSVRLLRAFYYASERERGFAAKDKMIHALGNLAALCPSSSVRSLAVRACERYRFCTGNNFDPASRRAAAAALRTIAVRASNVFRDGGRGDVWCTLVLPVAFLGRKDSDGKIAAMWQEVWDEGGSVASFADSSSSMSSFGTRLEEKLLTSLVKEAVLALQDVSWERRKAGATSLNELCEIKQSS